MLRYVRKHSPNYCSFYDARLKDTKMSSIQGSEIFRHSSILRKRVYSFFKGGAEQREHKATKKLVRMLQKMPQVAQINKEVILNKKSRVDLKIVLKSGLVILIEVKHDKSLWTTASTSSQVNRYSKVAKQLYGKKFHKTILCSPEGTYGYSFLELIRYLKSL